MQIALTFVYRANTAMNNRVWTWLKNQFNSNESSNNHKFCFWQTDIHSHFIPDVDDGVKSLDQSMICIRQLAEWGITKVITTPHISHRFFPNQESDLLAGRELVRQQIETEQLPVRFEVAAEYMLDEFFLERLDTGPLLSFGPERYLLVETGLLARPLLLNEILFRIQTAGYTPVLAHPERYPYFTNELASLEHLRDQGCLFQLNWMSVVGRYGSGAKAQAQLLLKHRWADFIGSDCHRPEDLPALRSLFGSATYDLLSQQPLRNTNV